VPGADFLLSGRSSAVLAGDLSASFMAANYMRDKIADAYKQTGMTGMKLTQGKKFFFEKLANKLPGRYRFLKGAAQLVGRTLDLGERAVRSPLGRGELAVAGAGTTGVAASLLDRNYIMFDISEDAIETCKRRIKNEGKNLTTV
jgi:hypothetical protein